MPGHITAHCLEDKWRSDDVNPSEAVDFSGLLLCDRVLAGLSSAGFIRPSPVQLHAIPLGRCGLDLIVQAKSGTGKTCVFAVVALENIILTSRAVQVLVLAPTREIAVQICDVVLAIGAASPGLRCHTFIGGIPVEEDKTKLKLCHIAIGTPGRIKYLIDEGLLKTHSIRLFVLDEADKLLDENFQQSINWIYTSLSVNKQVLALSATYPESLAQLLTHYMRNPMFVRLNANCPSLLGLSQYYKRVEFHPMTNIQFEKKVDVLLNLLKSITFNQCLVFSNFQIRAQSLCDSLRKQGWPVESICGNQQQTERLRALSQLKDFRCRVLVSTDLTARGIDAENVNLVINFDVPREVETYFHRIGRAGRFGSRGIAITFLSSDKDIECLDSIQKQGHIYIQALPEVLPEDLWQYSTPDSNREDSLAKSSEDTSVETDCCSITEASLNRKGDSASATNFNGRLNKDSVVGGPEPQPAEMSVPCREETISEVTFLRYTDTVVIDNPCNFEQDRQIKHMEEDCNVAVKEIETEGAFKNAVNEISQANSELLSQDIPLIHNRKIDGGSDLGASEVSLTLQPSEQVIKSSVGTTENSVSKEFDLGKGPNLNSNFPEEHNNGPTGIGLKLSPCEDSTSQQSLVWEQLPAKEVNAFSVQHVEIGGNEFSPLKADDKTFHMAHILSALEKLKHEQIEFSDNDLTKIKSCDILNFSENQGKERALSYEDAVEDLKNFDKQGRESLFVTSAKNSSECVHVGYPITSLSAVSKLLKHNYISFMTSVYQNAANKLCEEGTSTMLTFENTAEGKLQFEQNEPADNDKAGTGSYSEVSPELYRVSCSVETEQLPCKNKSDGKHSAAGSLLQPDGFFGSSPVEIHSCIVLDTIEKFELAPLECLPVTEHFALLPSNFEGSESTVMRADDCEYVKVSVEESEPFSDAYELQANKLSESANSRLAGYDLKLPDVEQISSAYGNSAELCAMLNQLEPEEEEFDTLDGTGSEVQCAPNLLGKSNPNTPLNSEESIDLSATSDNSLSNHSHMHFSQSGNHMPNDSHDQEMPERPESSQFHSDTPHSPWYCGYCTSDNHYMQDEDGSQRHWKPPVIEWNRHFTTYWTYINEMLKWRRNQRVLYYNN